jgi:MFS family permease
MLQSFALAVLTLTGRITIEWIVVLSVVQGVVNAFDMPGRQAFMLTMIENRQDLGNAIALNSSMVNAARLAGPALAGIIIAAVGEGWCFFIDGVSYIAVIASLLMMRITITPPAHSGASMLVQLREGWDYVTGFRPVRTILTLFALLSLMGIPYMVLMPIFALDVLHGGPHTLGALAGASGAGAIISAFSLALRKTVRGLTRMIQVAAAMFGTGLILFGMSHTLWLSMAMMMFTGFGMMQGMAASNTVIQTLVSPDKRGRVMSYYTMAFVGMAPFGSLLAGWLAHRYGAPHAVMITGTFCLLGALWYTTQLRPMWKVMRPIYIEMGIVEPAINEETEN